MKFTDLISAFYSASALASSNFRLDINIALCDIDVMGADWVYADCNPPMAQAFAASSGTYRQETRCLCRDRAWRRQEIKGPSPCTASGGRLARDFLRGTRNDRCGSSWSPARNLRLRGEHESKIQGDARRRSGDCATCRILASQGFRTGSRAKFRERTAYCAGEATRRRW